MPLIMGICMAMVSPLEAAQHEHISGQGLLNDRIDSISDGDTIWVSGVINEGEITIDRPMSLRTKDGAVLDGGGTGSVVVIVSDHVTIDGFTIRGTLVSNMKDHAGIHVEEARHVTITNNTLVRCFFGISLSGSTDVLVKNNRLFGHELGEDQLGNGIHVWKASRIEIRDNECHGHRDGIYFEFVTDSKVIGNAVTGNLRYGLHFMFSNRDEYRDNVFEANGAGVAVMYSHHINMVHNHFVANRGASAYGLLLKEINDAIITGNIIENNTTGMLVDGCNRIEALHNTLRSNGWALRLYANATTCTFTGNVFTGNTFDMSTNGNLMLNRIEGNYWDRYVGYDLDRDGFGDTMFRPLGFFSLLVERIPYAVIFSRSLFVSLLDRAERLLPTLTPAAMKDDRPLMRPPNGQG